MQYAEGSWLVNVVIMNCKTQKKNIMLKNNEQDAKSLKDITAKGFQITTVKYINLPL